jgi:glycosyltransferase involved in cell wall biosynthesis
MPLISVIMPVFNGEDYVGDAIRSVLGQSYSDFEFIIINDGSTDKSESVILGFRDERIRYSRNEKNLGLITTLNKAVAISTAPFIARMDADDVCETNRFEIQLRYLSEDQTAVMVCSPASGITPSGEPRDHWPDDVNTLSPEAIRHKLPFVNCISHPTVMIRADVLKTYQYDSRQKGSEDWDLWLRLARDGKKIIKTKESLLKYRVHPQSVTVLHNEVVSPQLKSIGVKWRFFKRSIVEGRLNGLVLKTIGTVPKDYVYYIRKFVLPLKLRRAKWIFTINPVTAYLQYKKLSTLPTADSRLFFFFPYSHMGGAEKVHARLVHLAAPARPLVFFTGIHDRGTQLEEFGNGANLYRCGSALYHPMYSKAARAIITAKINKTKNAMVFGANNDFFETLLLRLNYDISTADLTHDISYDNLEPGQDYIKAIQRLDRRLFISNKAAERTRKFYDAHFFDEDYYKRIRVVYNYTELPPIKSEKTWSLPLKVLYVGRDTPEKSIDRIFELAAKCLSHRLPVIFELAGEMVNRWSASNVLLHGIIKEREKLAELYTSAHFVIISSRSEGFPLSLMEGMAHGCVPLATPVGDIPFHIKNGVNGFVIQEGEDVAKQFFELLKKFTGDPPALKTVSENAFNYAALNFGREQFEAVFSELFFLSVTHHKRTR